MPSKLIVQIMPDGSLKTNARGMVGTEKEILAELNALAAKVGGTLTVEAHEKGFHAHHTHDDHVHGRG
ncbi:hypothetical protein M0Q28_05540 [Patescibacteria group bacterium]|nr:hypothetical protein [Patescibacteria group bacterium]